MEEDFGSEYEDERGVIQFSEGVSKGFELFKSAYGRFLGCTLLVIVITIVVDASTEAIAWLGSLELSVGLNFVATPRCQRP